MPREKVGGQEVWTNDDAPDACPQARRHDPEAMAHHLETQKMMYVPCEYCGAEVVWISSIGKFEYVMSKAQYYMFGRGIGGAIGGTLNKFRG